jgi:exportin-1
VIQTRWKVLPKEQRQGRLYYIDQRKQKHDISHFIGIRNFVVGFIIQASATPESLHQQRLLINKLNLVLVSILKQDWPHDWPDFINEIISSCRTNLSICENNMAILRLLSEEVFDFSAEQMTQAKIKNLKTTMCQEFSSIFQLCSEVLSQAEQPSLAKATLETLLRFLNWIPLGYIFETAIIETLRTRFLEQPEFRNVTMKCLTEIGGLQVKQYQYDDKLVEMFTTVMTSVSNIIPLTTDLRSIYHTSNSRDQEFIQNLALFLCNFFTPHVKVMVNPQSSWTSIDIVATAYRETSEQGFPYSCTFLSDSDIAN